MDIKSIFSFDKSIIGNIISGYDEPWKILPDLKDVIYALIEKLPHDEYIFPKSGVAIAKTAKVAESAHIDAPTVICDSAQIRHCAFIRGGVVIGRGAVVGNSCEIKNSILFDKAQVPHFNYVGDSILGYAAHLGAGAVTSNVKGNKTTVSITLNMGKFDTGLKKLGALIGDFAEIGCGAVLNPGTVIGNSSQIYPLLSVRGTVPKNSILKKEDHCVKKRETEI